MTSTDSTKTSAAPAPPVINSSRPAQRRRWWVFALILLPFLLFAWAAVGITGYFRLGSDVSALRQIALGAAGGSGHKIVGLRAGWFTTAAVRAGLHFVKLDPDVRTAVQAVRGAEVCVYDLQGGEPKANLQTLLARADQAMQARGFERAATVCQRKQVVIVYLAPSHFSSTRLRCCVLVLEDRHLVVAAVNANLKPALELVRRHWENGERRLPELAELALHD
jgi:hypothetical protein